MCTFAVHFILRCRFAQLAVSFHERSNKESTLPESAREEERERVNGRKRNELKEIFICKCSWYIIANYKFYSRMQRLLFWCDEKPKASLGTLQRKTGFNSHLQSNKLSTFCAKAQK